MASKAVKKIAYDKKLCRLLDEYTQILIAAVGNVGSNQLQNIRQRLRGDFVFLMGKNTIMKRSIRIHAEKTGNTAFLIQIPVLVGNVGLISTKGNLKEVREEVAKYKIALDQKRVVHPPTRLAQQVKLQQYQLIEQLQHPLRRLWHLLL